MAKKSGGGAGLLVLGVVIALLAAVPKQVWIVLAVVGLIGAIAYFIAKSKKEPPAPAPQPRQPWTAPPAPTPVWANKESAKAASFAQEPVSVYSGSPAQSRNRVPEAPAGYGAAVWIPPGQSVTVAGISLPGGMVYVGTVLRNPSGRPDPALIDPSKKVAARGDYTDRNLMGYWPSYSEIPPEARHAYLQWLAGGRKDPQADIGYVFLFLYGLERRAIVDGSGEGDAAKTAEADNPAIAQEVRRLLSIYGNQNGSFKRYANDFLTVVDLASFTDKLYSKPFPEFTGSHELPLYLRLALGQCAVDKFPVPAALALAWVRMDPNIYLRTPATRCPEQFERLFQQKYAEMLKGGLVLTKNKTKLKFVYRAASAGLHEYGEIKLTFGETPDVAVLTGPVKKLQEVAEAATTELDSYSRLLGRSPGAAKSLEGLLTLPPTLWGADARQKLDALLARMPGGGMVTMKLQELAASLGEAQSLERNLVTSLARALEAVHVGMEPDVLTGAKTPKAEDTVVLFSVAAGDTVSRGSATYQAAALTVQLATAVALADGDIGAEELRHLRHQIEGWTHLTPAHQQRLRAHMRYLLDTPPSLTVLKKKIEPLAMPAKEAIAKFMSVIAQADGTVSPVEIKMLEKVYKALGVDPQKVFSDVHAVAAAAPGGKRATPAPGSTLPDQDPASPGFQLDAARVAALQQDTDKVSALLANIFTEEAIEAPVSQQSAVMTPEPEEEIETPLGLKGLDDAHTAFVNQLTSRPEWTREELLDLSSDLDLMLDGALERINEAAFDAHDGPLTEGDDPVSINRDILEKEPA